VRQRSIAVSTSASPKGEERKVQAVGGAAIDGAPVAYVIVWAAVLAVLSFIPLPVAPVLGIGGSFPMSQAAYALVGIVLGPWGGALAAGIGRLIGIFTAPHTATAGLPSVLIAVVWAAGGGILVEKKGQKWLMALAFYVLAYFAYVGRALTRDVSLSLAIQTTLSNLSGILLWLLPTRLLARDWISEKQPARLAAGLALGCWIVNTCGHTFANALTFQINPWPANVWRILIPIIPVEQISRTIFGTVIGVLVISGLRAIGLVKPSKAGY
jgi:hypothetical protein